MFKIFWIDSRSMKSHKAIGGQIFKMFRLSWNYKKWSLWNSFETIKGTQRHQRLSLKMFQLSWKLLEMILTIFWTCYRHLEIDSRALRGPIGRVFSFLWLYNQPFYMPPNLPRALRKGAVSSFICFHLSQKIIIYNDKKVYILDKYERCGCHQKRKACDWCHPQGYNNII